jgi:hypothetical protein
MIQAENLNLPHVPVDFPIASQSMLLEQLKAKTCSLDYFIEQIAGVYNSFKPGSNDLEIEDMVIINKSFYENEMRLFQELMQVGYFEQVCELIVSHQILIPGLVVFVIQKIYEDEHIDTDLVLRVANIIVCRLKPFQLMNNRMPISALQVIMNPILARDIYNPISLKIILSLFQDFGGKLSSAHFLKINRKMAWLKCRIDLGKSKNALILDQTLSASQNICEWMSWEAGWPVEYDFVEKKDLAVYRERMIAMFL